MIKTCCFTCGKTYNAEYGTVIKFMEKGYISSDVTEYHVCKVCGAKLKTILEHREREEE